MIIGTHAIIYAEDAEATRAFLRDVLELPNVDAHGGWLIFKLPPAELGIHPETPDPEAPERPHDAEGAGSEGGPGVGRWANGRHELFLMCDDIDQTVTDLEAKGVEFVEPIADEQFGRITRLRLPGGGLLALYEARHATAYDLPGGRWSEPPS